MAGDADLQLNADLLAALPDQGPVVMLNLVRFRERSLDGQGSGRDAYDRYSRAVIGLIKARGGTVLWAGAVEGVALGVPDAQRWHYAVLVQYPSRAAFLDMMTSPAYADANRHRANGLADHLILATRQTYAK